MKCRLYQDFDALDIWNRPYFLYLLGQYLSFGSGPILGLLLTYCLFGIIIERKRLAKIGLFALISVFCF